MPTRRNADDVKAQFRDNIIVAGSVVAVGATLAVGAWMIFGRTPVVADQVGYRGVAMEQVEFADDKLAKMTLNSALPEEVYELEPDDGTEERAYEIYENVQVLGHLSDANFNRFMAQITEWVSPEAGCGYCHNNADGEIENFAGDYNYAKIVSRRMIQMTMKVNSEYDAHVNSIPGVGERVEVVPPEATGAGSEIAEIAVEGGFGLPGSLQGEQVAGVNCYTCHRGKNVPEYLWFKDPGTELEPAEDPFMGARNGQNVPVEANGYTDLNTDPFSAYILRNEPARVIYQESSIGDENRSLIKRTEHTYSFMIHMSKSLGVNCTYCHNSRNFADWSQSPPTRTTAWYGIQLSRHLNAEYLDPLQPVYPHKRLGPLDDAPKANCATCHQGNYKPLNGGDMITNYPSLWGPGPADMQDPMLTPEEVEAKLAASN